MNLKDTMKSLGPRLALGTLWLFHWLPLGLQVIGRAFDEETVFAVGAAIETAADFREVPALRAGA